MSKSIRYCLPFIDAKLLETWPQNPHADPLLGAPPAPGGSSDDPITVVVEGAPIDGGASTVVIPRVDPMCSLEALLRRPDVKACLQPSSAHLVEWPSLDVVRVPPRRSGDVFRIAPAGTLLRRAASLVAEFLGLRAESSEERSSRRRLLLVAETGAGAVIRWVPPPSASASASASAGRDEDMPGRAAGAGDSLDMVDALHGSAHENPYLMQQVGPNPLL